MINSQWIVEIGITVIGGVVCGLILYYVFGIGRSKKLNDSQGGRGGNAKVIGSNGVAIGGKGGGTGPGGKAVK